MHHPKKLGKLMAHTTPFPSEGNILAGDDRMTHTECSGFLFGSTVLLKFLSGLQSSPRAASVHG